MSLCKKLIDNHKFDLHIADDDGCTALHHSARNGSYDLINYFVSMGADINLKTKAGLNCLHMAALFGHLNLSKVLVDKHKFNVHVLDEYGCAALHHSAISGNYQLLTYFAGKGTDIHLKTDNGRNCLHFAAENGHLCLCKTLIFEHKFSVHIADSAGFTALHYSARNGSYDLVTYFVDMGTDIHLKTKNQSNCLYIAALFGHLDRCKTLVDKHKFDVHMANDDEYRALHFSAISGSHDLFLYFRGKGSDMYCKTKSMKNVLHFSASEGHFDICEFVLEHFTKDYKDSNSRNQYIYRSNYYNSQVFYKYNTIFLHAMDVHGNTYLHLAAERNQAKVCELLLKYDTETITLLNKKEETARKIATDNNHNDVLNVLKTEYEREGMFFLLF